MKGRELAAQLNEFNSARFYIINSLPKCWIQGMMEEESGTKIGPLILAVCVPSRHGKQASKTLNVFDIRGTEHLFVWISVRCVLWVLPPPPTYCPLHPDNKLTNARVGSLTVQDCSKWHIKATGLPSPLLAKRNSGCLETRTGCWAHYIHAPGLYFWKEIEEVNIHNTIFRQ